MSENKAVVAEPTTDFSSRDLEAIDKFKEDGLPNLMTLDEPKIERMFDLYLSGKSYHQISRIMRTEKVLILYLSNKFNWFNSRLDYFHELETNMRSRIIETKLTSQDFLLQLTQLWQKKIGNNITKYLQTGNEIHAKDIDLKEVDKYLKTIEILHKISNENSARGEGKPTVGLNLGDGVTIKKTGDNEVEITPKQKAVGDFLKHFADQRREEQNGKKN